MEIILLQAGSMGGADRANAANSLHFLGPGHGLGRTESVGRAPVAMVQQPASGVWAIGKALLAEAIHIAGARLI
jgi:hypothetical protein